ncbi:extracellular solute-binding protein [Paenibacillus sp. FSL H8-0457]|uniref:extracellular solute-binding protein n=1 Tax=Bacillales TaxID=1385 RepID=UPI0001789201|nr:MULTISPECIES: extracellular solute-binding protein [Paenibacillus]MBY0165133.1 extracellular solute-binding protein [Cytobacillus firmus]VTR18545.1 Lipoprotein lplA [Actinobacillus pleuropneumoniae]ACX68256.1 extracellular solute-binding protein family 1 [Paenibacillus sp. Y412MC10]MCM3261354.1 extracellular solute-binding protein [Paenibacillus lautus]PCL91365.1 ABC transporter substrate-binding protein [Paenibacillus lautus]
MKKLRKASSILLCLTLSATMLAACGSPKGDGAATAPSGTASTEGVKKEGFPIVDEPITLTVMSQDAGVADWNTMPVLQEMEKLSGIKLEYQLSPIDSFETKKNLVFASGDLPDMFYAADLKPAEQVTYGSQGILIPLEKYIDEGYAPNIKKIFDENPDVRKSFTTPDGHIYALPFVDKAAVWYRGPMWYNGKFLKALNVSEPKTTEELYTFLKRVKEEDPNGNGKKDEIPLTSVKLDDLRMYFFGFWGMYNEGIYSDKDGKVHYPYQEEGYKGYLTFMNRLWKEELLDHETFSQTGDQKKAKGENNQLALFNDYHAYFTLGGEPSSEHPLMTPVKSEIADSPVYGMHPGMSARGTFAISSSNPAPEATMRWIDYLYSYEGATLFNQGPEGTLWKFKDEANRVKEWLPVPGGGDREEYRGKITPNYGILTPGVNDPDVAKGLRTEFDEWIDQQNQEKLVPIGKSPFPNVYLTNEEQSEATALLSDLETYVKQMEAKFVTGQEPLENWDKYVAQVKKMGSDRLVELYQGAYDRWNAEQ